MAKIVKSKAKAKEEIQIVARLNNEFIIRYYSNEPSPDGIENERLAEIFLIFKIL